MNAPLHKSGMRKRVPFHPILRRLSWLLAHRKRKPSPVLVDAYHARAAISALREVRDIHAVSRLAAALGYELVLLKRDGWRRHQSEPVRSVLDNANMNPDFLLRLERAMNQPVSDHLRLAAAKFTYDPATSPVFRAVIHALLDAGLTNETFAAPDQYTRTALRRNLTTLRPISLDRAEAILNANGMAFKIVPYDEGDARRYTHMPGIDDAPATRMADVFRLKNLERIEDEQD